MRPFHRLESYSNALHLALLLLVQILFAQIRPQLQAQQSLQVRYQLHVQLLMGGGANGRGGADDCGEALAYLYFIYTYISLFQRNVIILCIGHVYKREFCKVSSCSME